MWWNRALNLIEPFQAWSLFIEIFEYTTNPSSKLLNIHIKARDKQWIQASAKRKTKARIEAAWRKPWNFKKTNLGTETHIFENLKSFFASLFLVFVDISLSILTPYELKCKEKMLKSCPEPYKSFHAWISSLKLLHWNFLIH